MSDTSTTIAATASTASNVTAGFNWGAVLADVIAACLPILLNFFQAQADRPHVVVDAVPDPVTDDAFAKAAEDDIAAGRVDP